MNDWKPYPLNPLYEVSTSGEVRNTKTGAIRKPRKCNKGYMRLNMYLNGKHTTIPIHQMVAYTFLPNPLGHTNVNHIDNDPTNNSVGNLEWCTAKENCAHTDKQGRRDYTRGSKRKYDEKDIYAAKYELNHLSATEVEKLLGIHRQTVIAVRARKQWIEI